MGVIRRTVIVAAVGSSQVSGVYRPNKGERVRAVSWMRQTPADGGSTATISIGDGGSATRYANAVTAAGASGDLIDGATYNVLYLALDTISVTYTPGGGPGATSPVVALTIEVETIWPKYA